MLSLLFVFQLLKDVHCPPHLASRLRKQWLTEDPSSPYYLIHEVVMTLDTACEDGSASEEEPEGVLLDTLYRYVLCPYVQHVFRELFCI